MTTHIFADGSYGIGHVRSERAQNECPCKPQRVTTRKQASSGRGGKHQGYKVSVSFKHNSLK